jgi:5-formyltetrahydrofolate cyclo-ligase
MTACPATETAPRAISDKVDAKARMRREMRVRRRAVSAGERAEASGVICARLMARADVGSPVGPSGGSSPVAVYLATPDEIDLRAFIERMLRSGRRVVAPRWNGESYELAVLRGLGARHVRRGPMGVMEPVAAETVRPKDVCAWIVPGLAFTRGGRRLGYGGGWYDRLLADASTRAVKLGVAYSFQVVDDIPAEAHDVPLTAVVDDAPSAT